MFRKLVATLLCLWLCTAFIAAEQKPVQRQTVIFHVPIVCDGCVEKIQKNIAFEKGVRDMQIDKDAQTVTIVYNPQKTDEKKLIAAFAAIKKPVSKVEYPSTNH